MRAEGHRVNRAAVLVAARIGRAPVIGRRD
jgi:hypothetical protein